MKQAGLLYKFNKCQMIDLALYMSSFEGSNLQPSTRCKHLTNIGRYLAWADPSALNYIHLGSLEKIQTYLRTLAMEVSSLSPHSLTAVCDSLKEGIEFLATR